MNCFAHLPQTAFELGNNFWICYT